MSDLYLFGVPGLGMILVSLLAVAFWRRASSVEFKWFLAGAGLWAVAVIFKAVFALLANRAAVGFLHWALPSPLFFPGIGLYLGIESAAFEVGLTWLAGRRWSLMGRDPNRAVAVGVGAGAIEALLLGCIALGAGLAAVAGEDMGEDRGYLSAHAEATPMFWLEPPVGRFVALLGHVSSRALVLLGVADRRPWIVVIGFTIFALVDGTGGALLASQVLEGRSMWWIDAATLPFNLIGIAFLVWYFRGRDRQGSRPSGALGTV
jgi:YhfC intramembrane metalloprotease